jgi:indole-3-glycerol phosphate synthase
VLHTYNHSEQLRILREEKTLYPSCLVMVQVLPALLLLLSPIHALLLSKTSTTLRFQQPRNHPSPPRQHAAARWSTQLSSSASVVCDNSTDGDAPQIFSSGYSTKGNLLEALQEAVHNAVKGLPLRDKDDNETTPFSVDVCMVHISSLYDGGSYQPSTVAVPSILAAASTHNVEIGHIIGSSCAGVVTSTVNPNGGGGCRTFEVEATPVVAVTLGVLPGTQLKTFHVDPEDVPQGRTQAQEWKRAVGLLGVGEDDPERDAPLFWIIPHPAFSADLPELLQGLEMYFPGSQTVGGIASTVSSLSRAKLYRWSRGVQDVSFVNGCVGLAMSGDVELKSMTALGAKPVGGIYQILKGQDTRVEIIVIDQTATEALKLEKDEDEEDEEEEEEETPVDARAAMAQLYAKAQVPKPVLAEANFLMRTLSDDDQAFMRRQLLVGLDQGGALGQTASDLARLAEGQGHRFTIHPVAGAGMKDGSVTLPLGSVNVTPGTRLRFYVREPDFARKELNALWTGYKKRVLNDQFDNNDDSKKTFTPAVCFIVPTLDRGNKFFQGKPGFESSTAARTLPGVPCISGFYCNGIVGKMDGCEDARVGIQGSASGYFLLGSKSGRPIYSAAAAAADKAAREEERAAQEAEDNAVAAADAKRVARIKSAASLDQRAPRSEDGELILKRREVHSGRALTVSTVEWSVAEKTARPSSALEGYMWDKETEVDRFRERVPLANLLSQCRLSASDPNAPKPRDWVGAIKCEAADGNFVIIPECKRSDPSSGSLWKRYDLSKLVREFTKAGAPAISVNCDSILFGGSLEQITEAREASSQAAVEEMSEDGVIVPPILASDLILYPYQLYKLRLAGADAMNLIGGALANKDLLYLTKIASSLQLQSLVTVTTALQLQRLVDLPSLDGVIVSNRELEDFSFDETGEQVLSLLQSDAMKAVKAKHGDDLLVLAEGRIGLIERPADYLKELRVAGALGAIVGAGLAGNGKDAVQNFEYLQQSAAAASASA